MRTRHAASWKGSVRRFVTPITPSRWHVRSRQTGGPQQPISCCNFAPSSRDSHGPSRHMSVPLSTPLTMISIRRADGLLPRKRDEKMLSTYQRHSTTASVTTNRVEPPNVRFTHSSSDATQCRQTRVQSTCADSEPHTLSADATASRHRTV